MKRRISVKIETAIATALLLCTWGMAGPGIGALQAARAQVLVDASESAPPAGRDASQPLYASPGRDLETTAAAMGRPLPLDLVEVRLEEALWTIARQSGLGLSYNPELIPERRVSVHLEEGTVGEALRVALAGTGLTSLMSRSGEIVVVASAGQKMEARGLRSAAPADLLAPADLQVVQGRRVQEGVITGTVIDSTTGNPLPGVNVLLQGTQQGAATGPRGGYTISDIDPGTYAVQASFVGYKRKVIENVEVASDQTTTVDVALQKETAGLDEVVVVGYGEQQREDLTGSISSVTPEDIESQPITRVAEALQARTPGVQVTRTGGQPGGGIKVRIRGANSLRGGNRPLVVVDGFIGGDMSDVDPDDIASIDVLKDASATAIYGSRGANGVIIIETKRGQEGEPRVNFDSFLKTSSVPKKFDLLGPVEYAEVVNEKNRVLGENPTFSEEDLADIQRQGGTDWQDAVFQTGLTQSYTMDVSGGTPSARYYVSGHYTDEQGIIINSDHAQYALRANLNSQVGSALDFRVNLSGTRENSHNANAASRIVAGAVGYSPNLSIRDENGEYVEATSYSPVYPNPVFRARERNADRSVTDLLATAQANLDILDDLTLTVNGSVQSNTVNRRNFNRNQPGSAIASASGGVSDIFRLNWQHSEVLTYSPSFGENHRIEASAIFEQQNNTVRRSGAEASNFPTLALGYSGLGLGATQFAESGFTESSLQSYVGRVNYTLLGRYLFTGTARVDGTSRFAKERRYDLFPSAALAWRLSEEPFMQGIDGLSNLKVRASWGLTGSQAIGPYAILSALDIDEGTTLDGSTLTTGIAPDAPANPALTWETTEQVDVGLDLSLLEERLSLTADYYVKNTRDLLLQVSVPQYTGFGNILRNLGSVRNRGVELSLSGVPVQNENFSWQATANFSANRNKVVDLGNPEEEGESIFINDNYLGGLAIAPSAFVVKEGRPLGLFYGLIYEGVWQEGEAEEAARYGQKPGDARYRDLNDNGEYDDLTVIGNANPDFTVGLSSSLRYKNLTLDFLVHAVQGGQILNAHRYSMISGAAQVKNATSPDVLDRWSPSNPDSNIPAFSSTSVTEVQSSLFIEDGSYIRLRNVTLGYSLPTSLLSSTFVRDARLYLSAQDPITFTGYSGYDPEVTNSGQSDVARRIDTGAYPNPRAFTFGVEVTL